jgi:hypothetical protein
MGRLCYPSMHWVEGEYVYLNYGAVKSRVRNRQIVPYVVVEPIKDLPFPIVSVTCGPEPSSELDRESGKIGA